MRKAIMKLDAIIAEHARMRELERFGVGDFNDRELADKTDSIKRQMALRNVPKQPRISVIVPAHREERYILGTLRSLAEQTNSDCEFIVVSNGESVGNLTQRLSEASGFRVIHDPRSGISRARQIGLEAANGDIIVTTDADTLHHSQWLDRISEIMMNENILCGAGLLKSLSRKISIRAAQAFIAWTMQVKNWINPRLVTGVSEANSFYRRDLALVCGGYDPATRVGEGIMLFKNLRKPGIPIIFTDEELVVYTSGRRIEREGPLRWLRIAMHNTTLQLIGKKGVDDTTYPDIR